ncbi:MAG TPA: hypothetical protein PJ986_20540 [Gammaproteobacteria bacterium]|nr:hypothetical protein [Gammaproteobacteria bacterium]
MSAFGSSSTRYRQPFDPITAVLFKIIQAITYLFVLAVLFMNPIAKQGKIDPKAEYIITVTWPDRNPNDIDTYVEDPAGNLTYFKNPSAGLIHLDRDDRGNLNDTLNINGRQIENPLNQEVTTIRGVIPGEYIVNVHYYATENNEAVPVTVRVDKVNPVLEVIYYDTVTLKRKDEERTAVRFSIIGDGRVANINHVPKSLVAKAFKRE